MINVIDNRLVTIAATATEKAAIAAYNLKGQRQEKAADQLAVEAMRQSLNAAQIDGIIVIGEGERDDAPMLYIGEHVGMTTASSHTAQHALDIAVDPLEGTTLLAYDKPGALSVIAFAPQGGFLHAPDIYMDKIAIGMNYHERIIDLDNLPKENLKNLSIIKKCSISDLVVTILNRPRHEELIARVREAGARVKLIEDGDVAGIIGTSALFSLSDIYMGIGGAPEGILAASAMQNLGGQLCARLLFKNDKEKYRAKNMGIIDYNKQYFLNDLAHKETIFVATGVTDGELLQGVQLCDNQYITNSLIMHQGQVSKFHNHYPI